MKKISITNIVLFVLLVVTIAYASYNNIERPKKVGLKTYADSLSYALGYIYGLDVAEVPFEFNMKVLFQGLVNASDAQIEVLTDEEIINILELFSEKMASIHLQEHEDKFNVNVNEGKLFMEENSLNPEVITTESGIQYRVIKAGNGKRTQSNSTVVAHYTGRFINGDVFDSSHHREEPMTFEIDTVIDGWGEGLLLMREGDLFEFVIPYDLAYGQSGYDIIEPGTTLIFEIELIEVK